MTSPKKRQRLDTVKEVTCSAPVNIAVIKYWGKRNPALILPTNSSLSLTLNQDHLRSTTTCRISPELDEDKLWLNGKEESVDAKRFANVLDEARKCRKEMESKDEGLSKLSDWHVVIASVNNFPTAAGLASSASGFACLTYALFQLYDLPMSLSQVSRLARIGSGSACRSLFGGFVKWEMGTDPDGLDSVAVQVADEKDWNGMEALILVVSDARKDTGSSIGMQESVKTSTLLKHRIKNVVPKRMLEMERAIKQKDFDQFAEITMQDSNQFHAICLDTYPPIFYMNDISKGVIKLITLYNNLFLQTDKDGNTKGYRVCYTFDAGPNAVLYLQNQHLPDVLGLINHFFPNTVDTEEYYGRSQEYLERIDAIKVQKLVSCLDLKPFPNNSLCRIISTVVGDGPRVLSKEYDSKVSLLNLQNTAK